MRLLILPFVLIRSILINNPYKTVLLVISFIFWYYAGTIKQQRIENTIYHQFEMNGQWYGVYGTEPNIMVLNQKPVLIGKEKNIYVFNQYHPGNVFLWMAFCVSILVLIVGSFIDDGWEFDDIMKNTLSVFIRCDIEDGVFVYTIFGRLLAKYKNQVETTNFHQLSSVSSLLTLPKYETKMSKRARLLRIIGI